MNWPIASARLTDAMLRPVVEMMGSTNSPLTWRMPVVISIPAAAATTSKVVFLAAEPVMGGHVGVRLGPQESLHGGRFQWQMPRRPTLRSLLTTTRCSQLDTPG